MISLTYNGATINIPDNQPLGEIVKIEIPDEKTGTKRWVILGEIVADSVTITRDKET